MAQKVPWTSASFIPGEDIKDPVVTQVSDGSLLPPCPNLLPQSASLVGAG